MPRGTGRRDEPMLQRRLWTPDIWLGGLEFWFDAQDGRFTFATGISQWNDKSGLANHVSQATTTKQPVLTSNYLNGLPAVVFDGVDDILLKSSFTNAAAWSTFAVWQNSSVTGVHSVVDTDSNAGAGTRHGQNLRQNGTALESIAFNTSNSAFTDAASGTLAINTPVIGSAVRGATTVEAWCNGVSNGSTATTGTPTAVSTRLSIASNGGGAGAGTAWLAGGMSEVVSVPRALATYERELVEGYLAWKWWPRQENTLPASHRFKNRPPLIGD